MKVLHYFHFIIFLIVVFLDETAGFKLHHLHHPATLSVEHVFFGERRHAGFGKFVGSGNVKID